MSCFFSLPKRLISRCFRFAGSTGLTYIVPWRIYINWMAFSCSRMMMNVEMIESGGVCSVKSDMSEALSPEHARLAPYLLTTIRR